MNKIMNYLIMYHEIHKLKQEGFTSTQIGKKLGFDSRTIKKYLTMSEEEFLEFKHSQSNRKKLLDSYEEFVRFRLEQCPEASSAQVHDWLKEHFDHFVNVSDKTVFNFVLSVRDKHGIPKPFDYRDHIQVEMLPYGKQIQVDFGEYNMTTEYEKRKKVYFATFVLARSRCKYVYFTEKPFTTDKAIESHEKAFEYFGGYTQEIVYDQDKVFLVDENKGELILTGAFRQYVQYRSFKLYFCRKADPESKGKVENVIKYVKYNFLRGRKYIGIDYLNGQAYAWLERTANVKVHSATKKIPAQELLKEKPYLKQASDYYLIRDKYMPYTVRKDNTISYKGNYYTVPLGTYNGPKTKVYLKAENAILTITDGHKDQLATHRIPRGKGQLIRNNNHLRDHSIKINQLIKETAMFFTDKENAKNYLEQVRQQRPRYVRDQLKQIKEVCNDYVQTLLDETLSFCIENNIYSSIDFKAIVSYKAGEKVKPVFLTKDELEKAEYNIVPEKSDIIDYESIINNYNDEKNTDLT